MVENQPLVCKCQRLDLICLSAKHGGRICHVIRSFTNLHDKRYNALFFYMYLYENT